MKTIPLTVNFDQTRIIGKVVLSNEAIEILRKNPQPKIGTQWLSSNKRKFDFLDLVGLSITDI